MWTSNFLTTRSPEVPDTHLIDLEKMTQWTFTADKCQLDERLNEIR